MLKCSSVVVLAARQWYPQSDKLLSAIPEWTTWVTRGTTRSIGAKGAAEDWRRRSRFCRRPPQVDLRLLFQQWESSKRVRLQMVERSIEPEACNTSEYLRWTRPVYYLLNDTVRQWLVGTSRRPGSRPVLQHVLQSTLSSYYGVFQVSITGTHLRR